MRTSIFGFVNSDMILASDVATVCYSLQRDLVLTNLPARYRRRFRHSSVARPLMLRDTIEALRYRSITKLRFGCYISRSTIPRGLRSVPSASADGQSISLSHLFTQMELTPTNYEELYSRDCAPGLGAAP